MFAEVLAVQGLWFGVLVLGVGFGEQERLPVVFVVVAVPMVVRKRLRRRILLDSNVASIWLFCWGLRNRQPGEIKKG